MKRSTRWGVSLCAIALFAVAGCGTSTAPASNAGSNTGNTAANAASGGGAGSANGSTDTHKTTAIGINATVDANAQPGDGKIVIGVDNTYPPMEYMDPQDPTKLVGFDVDLGDALGQALGKQVIWKPTAWDGIQTGLLSDKYDIIISTMNDTPERRQKIDFIDYMNFGQAIVVKKGSTENIQSLADLKGKNVGVEISTTSEDALKKEGGINIKEYNSFPDAFQDLANGRLDAAVVDEVVARYYINLQPDKYQMAGKPFDAEPVGIGIRKDETQLEKDLKSALDKIKADGTYDKIYTYWFGKE
ncbi:basic amino acid ABC transporter substrate-binding protein [Alicyclobacillus sp.]|uniref:substrate-binding periplasmic protein n=1 Tax=Alicyclobacillus sp. TaxID=61169 RepID=UPI0025C1D39A|nr:basic amino acid ABC transporter substrate-binding protein [Alicyclobacillus sp.]MCL6517812.1 basic amino acid ABC transporter substrate-binding protein [Alicyclobacillus sp.]